MNQGNLYPLVNSGQSYANATKIGPAIIHGPADYDICPLSLVSVYRWGDFVYEEVGEFILFETIDHEDINMDCLFYNIITSLN